MRSLMDSASGVFVVATRSSTYIIDLDYWSVSRLPGHHPHEVASMRRDGDSLPLLHIEECTVGRCLLLIVDLSLPDAAWTLRASTPVRSIAPLSAKALARAGE
jgi:hypothetical protein